MDHRDARDHLSAFADGSLPPEDRARVESHLEACPECRADLAEERHLIGLLRAIDPVDPPRAFTLTAELIRPTPIAASAEKVRWLRPVRYLTAIAALLLVVMMAREALPWAPSTPSAAPKVVSSSATETKVVGTPAPTPTAGVFGAAANRTPAPDPTPAPAPRTASDGRRLPFQFGPPEVILALIVIGGGTASVVGARRRPAAHDAR